MGQFISCLNCSKIDGKTPAPRKKNSKCMSWFDDHYGEITETLAPNIVMFLDFLQKYTVISSSEREIVDKKTTNEEKVMVLLDLVKMKDEFRDSLVTYLENNGYKILAHKLKISLENTNKSPYSSIIYGSQMKYAKPNSIDYSAAPIVFGLPTSQPTNFITDFKCKLAEHYKTEYSRIPTVVLGHSKPIEKVWVPLRIDDTTEDPKSSEKRNGFDHVELLKRLANPKNPHVGLVKGHPGVGKTTLVKKIAYDWANGKIDHYSLVLAVPLRDVDSAEDLLQMAVNYFGLKFGLSSTDKVELFNALMQLGRQLLLCFDGLDEYSKLAQSPFKTLFDSQFEVSEPAFGPNPPRALSYQLLIISRPYACDRIKQGFCPLIFEISSLDEPHLHKFVELYCETHQGIVKVTEYLEINKKLVIKVPLILTFVCVLADNKKEIPTKLTLLYDRLLGLMIRREMERNTLIEKISIDNWKNENFIKSTLQLAFDGCRQNKFEFPERVHKALGVSEDNFTCGFLLRKFDFGEGCLTAEFLHRSIQEFFAAVHCYQLILNSDKSERNSVMTLILNTDSQFGRFFFGVCSDENKFERMLEWVNPTLDDAEMITTHLTSFDPSLLWSLLSNSLFDCSEAEAKLLGQKLAASLGQLEKKIKTERKSKIKLWEEDLSSMNKSFQYGLNLNFLDDEEYSWSLYHADKPRLSHLTYVYSDLPVNLREKFEKIQVFIWIWNHYDQAGMISSLDRLPTVSTLIVQTGSPDFEVNFDLNYEMAATMTKNSDATQLQHFTFGFDKDSIRSLKNLLSGQPVTDDLIIGETNKTGEKAEISWLTVAIKQSLGHSQLVRTSIRLAVEMCEATEMCFLR